MPYILGRAGVLSWVELGWVRGGDSQIGIGLEIEPATTGLVYLVLFLTGVRVPCLAVQVGLGWVRFDWGHKGRLWFMIDPAATNLSKIF